LNLIRITPAKGQDNAMQTSVFLARLLGPTLLLVGAGILLNQRYYRGMTSEFIASRPLFYLASIIGVVGGLAIVLVHNVWVLNWRVLITLLGWINLLRGAFSILLPEQSFTYGGRMIGSQYMPVTGGVVALLIGLTLSYFGYTARG
jgi:hypothetical protein